MDTRIDVLSPTPAQYRAARAALGWSLIVASQHLGISVSAVLRSERDDDVPQNGSVRFVVKPYYEAAGISFVQLEKGLGLCWRTTDIRPHTQPAKTL